MYIWLNIPKSIMFIRLSYHSSEKVSDLCRVRFIHRICMWWIAVEWTRPSANDFETAPQTYIQLKRCKSCFDRGRLDRPGFKLDCMLHFSPSQKTCRIDIQSLILRATTSWACTELFYNRRSNSLKI